MDAVIGLVGGLAGVGLGWGLSFATTRRSERKEARRAAALILGELLMNKLELESIHSGSDFYAMRPLQRTAWDTYGMVLLRLLDGNAVSNVLLAYASLEYLHYNKNRLQAESRGAQSDIDEAMRLGGEETADQAKWRNQKGEIVKAARDDLNELAARIPEEFLEDIKKAVSVLNKLRPFGKD